MSKKKIIQLEKTNAKLAKELLQKERELKIESSLEKVRIMAMAMTNRDDMLTICRAISTQLKLFGVKEIRNVQTAIFYKEKGIYMNYEYYTKHRKTLITETNYGTVKLERDFAKKMLKGKGEFFFTHLKGKKVKEWLDYQKTTNVFIDKFLESASSLNYYWYSLGPVALGISTYHPLAKNEQGLFHRFVNVFELAYRKYLDIENADTQAREALIQASLERVRAGSLAMLKSDELIQAGELLWHELRKLGIESLSSGYVVMDRDEKIGWTYAPNPATGKIHEPLGLVHTETKEMRKVLESWKNKEPMSIIEMNEEETIAHQTFVAENGLQKNGMNSNWITAEQLIALSPKRLSLQNFNFNEGYLMIVGGNRLNDREIEIMLRFTKVFQQTYTRFLDLQKAEEQTREAQIEAALERVRSRSIGMRKSEELKEVIKIVYDQFIYLNIHIDHAGFVVDYTPMGDWHFWIADKQDIPAKISTPYFDSVWGIAFNEAKEQGLDFFPTHLNFEDKNKFYQKLLSFVPDLPEESKNFYLNCPGLAGSTALSENVSLYIENFSGIPYSDEENKILIRFGKVFQQTYTRFLDLEKAEAQAREAQIEAALERVRSRAMAMQNSGELADIVDTVFRELTRLHFSLDRCIIMIFDPETNGSNWWLANPEPGVVPVVLFIKYHEHKPYLDILNAWKTRMLKWQYLLEGNSKKEWDGFLFNETDLSLLPEPVIAGMTSFNRIYLNTSFNNFGCLIVSSVEPLQDENFEILLRFAKVFDSTYTRFNDLKQAEALTRQAIQRASVDRIRAEIASMRTTKDLERITPLIWNELTTIGVPFIRCGVLIMDEEQQQINIFLSTPEGKGIAAAFHLPYTANRETMQIVSHWNKKEMYRPHWDEAAFIDFTKVLGERGAITTGEKFLVESRPSDLYLHFLPFQQGMLYVGDTNSLNNEHLQLVQALAEAFSTAYLRYEDFNKLESAKAQIEKTLVDLKQAQSQLVQSEKMASLGELTAGIAHEIQNPLNFVNNFSEVNNELIQELTIERAKPNNERNEMLENELLDNIRQNLEKINNHGKRADGIVKGMLQHSRSSSGQKELTDINALADEYLRLSYHGYRAKEKFFNAKFETDFDMGLKKLNVVSHDIGRVILNLINNAFYAVYEKRKVEEKGYEAAVKVATRQSDNQVFITVSDNGNGIPKNIVDKIFQPFFTTKPTGSGTGLGLSLAYDIIKAHGGDIKVTTKEGEGTEFIIHLPAF